MNKEKLNKVLVGLSHTGYTTELERCEARLLLEEQDKEIERLNNIINELEKWLEEQHQFIIEIPAYTKEISIEHKTMEICYENVLDKLQELKGDSSND